MIYPIKHELSTWAQFDGYEWEKQVIDADKRRVVAEYLNLDFVMRVSKVDSVYFFMGRDEKYYQVITVDSNELFAKILKEINAP